MQLKHNQIKRMRLYKRNSVSLNRSAKLKAIISIPVNDISMSLLNMLYLLRVIRLRSLEV